MSKSNLSSSMPHVHKYFIKNIPLLSNGFEIERENSTPSQIQWIKSN